MRYAVGYLPQHPPAAYLCVQNKFARFQRVIPIRRVFFRVSAATSTRSMNEWAGWMDEAVNHSWRKFKVVRYDTEPRASVSPCACYHERIMCTAIPRLLFVKPRFFPLKRSTILLKSFVYKDSSTFNVRSLGNFVARSTWHSNIKQ